MNEDYAAIPIRNDIIINVWKSVKGRNDTTVPDAIESALLEWLQKEEKK